MKLAIKGVPPAVVEAVGRRDWWGALAPLEALEPFDEADFSDLLHTTPRGAAKLTRGLVKLLRDSS